MSFLLRFAAYSLLLIGSTVLLVAIVELMLLISPPSLVLVLVLIGATGAWVLVLSGCAGFVAEWRRSRHKQQHVHAWRRRVDGRQCAQCGKVELGVWMDGSPRIRSLRFP